MRAGKLNQRITIQSRSAANDTVGQRVLVWSEFAKIWSDVRLQNGKGVVTAGREAGVIAGSMRIRPRSDLSTDMRILWGGQIFDIKAIVPFPDGMRDCMDLVVESGANNG